MPKQPKPARGAVRMYQLGRRTVQWWAGPDIYARLRAMAAARGVSLAGYARVATLAALAADEELAAAGLMRRNLARGKHANGE